jgi:hypothetical protein
VKRDATLAHGGQLDHPIAARVSRHRDEGEQEHEHAQRDHADRAGPSGPAEE